MHRILVTGSNGQLGHEIRRVSLSDKSNIFFHTDVGELDITKREHVENFIRKNNVDIVINCAAYTQVDKAEEDEDTAYLINATAVNILSNVCATYNILLIHISTDYVFDGRNSTPYTEKELTSPIGVYGKSKREGEVFIQDSGCDYIIIRTAWLYSSFGRNFVKTIGLL